MKNISNKIFSAFKGNILKLDEEGTYILKKSIDTQLNNYLEIISEETDKDKIKTEIEEYNFVKTIGDKIYLNNDIGTTLTTKEISYLTFALDMLYDISKKNFDKNANTNNFDTLCKDVALCNMMKEILIKLHKSKKEEAAIDEEAK